MRKETIIALVLIVCVLLALTYVVVARPFGGQSYITVQADKSSYTVGEPITFKLVSQTQFAHFNGDGMSYDSGIYISKIPQGMTVDEFLNSTDDAYDYIWPWLNHQPQVRFSLFNGNSAPLELRWDGTYTAYNGATDSTDTFYATSGYYFLYPQLFVSQGDYVHPTIDRGSVFYLNSLNVSTSISFDHTSRELTMGVTVSGPNQEDGLHVLNSSMMYSDILEEQPYTNQTLYGGYSSYINETFRLSGVEEWNGTVSAILRAPDVSSAIFTYVEVVVGEQRYGLANYISVEEGGYFRASSSL